MKNRMHLGITFVAAVCLAACAASDASSTPPAHPALECSGGGSGTGNYDLIGPGFATAAEALADRLAYYRGLYGGEIVPLADDEGALQVDGLHVVIARASAAPSGEGFLVQEDYFCNEYQPQ